MTKKIKLAITLILMAIGQNLNAQDLITFLNGNELKSKILEVSTTEIKYKKFDNLEGPTFTSLKTDILMIKYQNGTKEVFKDYLTIKSEQEEKTEKVQNETVNSGGLYDKGFNDAQTQYTNHSPAGGGTLATTVLVGGILGLIPAIACSSTTPSDNNLGIKDSKLAENSDYKNGFREGARKKKSRKVWTNFGIGCLTNVVVYIALIAGQN